MPVDEPQLLAQSEEADLPMIYRIRQEPPQENPDWKSYKSLLAQAVAK